ncbi:MAG TPA: hypothetical protein VIN08_11975 [Ohtaekwangia sp.]|uniref:hypothetical protein n=1 Tax=Ohtaekwangia sp. TaxID=2066019 RepID=UPI002F94107D
MTGVSRQFMRMVLMVLLFQFLSPAFFTIVTQRGNLQQDNHGISVHAHHSSIVLPQLLKEKDESETEFKASAVADILNFVPLIDFTNHSFVLAQLHTSRLRSFVFHDRINHQPPLFTLHSVYII